MKVEKLNLKITKITLKVENVQKSKGEEMIKGYILSVMCISIIGSLISMLSPEGEGGGIGKNIRLIFGLCVVLVCINPIKDIVLQIKDLDFDSIIELPDGEGDRYDEIFDSSYSSAEIENLKEGIKQMLFDRFNIDGTECSVLVKVTSAGEGKSRLEHIFITLYGSAIFKNTDEIEEYIGKIFGCEVITAIG